MKKNHGVLFGLAVIAIAAITLFAGCSNGSTDDAPTAVVLAAGSHGTAGNGAITGLEAVTYVVKTGATWFGVDDGGELVIPGHSSPADAIADAEALDGEVTAITGLSNGTTYSVYEYFATALDDDKKVVGSGGSSGDVNTGGKNTIVNIDAGTLQTTESITIEAGASAGGASLVFLTGKAQLAEAAGPVSVHTRIKGNTTDGLTYSLSAVEGTANLAAVTEDDTYFSINNISADFTAVITANTAVATVLKATKSQGAVNGVTLNGLTTGTYVVQHRGKWYATSTGGSSGVFEAGTAYNTFAEAITNTSATNTTVILTGLTADEIYDVYRVLTAPSDGNVTMNASSATLQNGGLNAIVNVSAITTSSNALTISIGSFTTGGDTTIYVTGLGTVSAINPAAAVAAQTIGGFVFDSTAGAGLVESPGSVDWVKITSSDATSFTTKVQKSS